MFKSVVTGGAGFIGSHLAETLLSQGQEVLVIDNFYTGLRENISMLEKKFSSKISFSNSDVGSSETLEKIVEFSPDFIFHLAAQGNVRKSVTDPIFDAQVNILGTINLLQAARKINLKGFIFSSTGGAVYGEQETFPADETHPTLPECPYGLSKKSVELYLQYYARQYGFKCVALRYANVYGPRQNPKGETGVLAVFVERLLQNKGLVVNGDGEQTRDFVYVSDVVSANLEIAQAIFKNTLNTENNFNIFNVGTGIETTVNQIVDSLKNAWEKINPEQPWPEKVGITNGPAVAGEQRRSVINSFKLKGELNWNWNVWLNVGVVKTLESFLRK